MLIAGIGNVFLGDDGFGVEVVRRLLERPPQEPLRVIDFGVRGFDLACALLDGYDAAILVDATEQGGAPGTLYVIDADTSAPPEPSVSGHALDPSRVFALAHALGGTIPPVRVVGCEPESLDGGEGGDGMTLSAPVRGAIEPAVDLVLALAARLSGGHRA